MSAAFFFRRGARFEWACAKLLSLKMFMRVKITFLHFFIMFPFRLVASPGPGPYSPTR